MRKVLLSIMLFGASASLLALDFSSLTEKDAVSGLKQALEQGADKSVGKLGRPDGFLGNPRVRIPLPDSLQKADRMLHRFGMGKYTDDLQVSMNRAAELAVPEAKALLFDAVRHMTVQDAKKILTGGDTAATDYFRSKTAQPLTEKFLPIVRQATIKVQLAQKYDQFASRAARFGLLDEKQANLEAYVTQKALDGLYLMIADEEKEIRAHPAQQASKLLKKVFGALLN